MKKKTDTLRVDPEFKEWIKEMCRMKSYQENDKIDASRITQAVFNLRKKYPIDNEIKLSKLGRWKGR